MYKRLILIFTFIIFSVFTINCVYGNILNTSIDSLIVMDKDAPSIIYGKNIHKRIYPASTTKILTAILAIENLNLNSNITASKEAVDVPYLSSTIYLKEGEILTVRDLLYGLLLRSGNDAANVLAEAVSGSIPNFMLLMNSKLKELGCNNTHFTNPHGYHDEKHYSTAYDMAILMKYVTKNNIFKEISEAKEYIVNSTNKTDYARKFKNTNSLLYLNLDYTLVGKTGYTDEAGNAFISYAYLEDKSIICGVFKGPSRDKVFDETKVLVDNTFENFYKTKILDKDTFRISYIDKNKGINYIFGIKDDIYCLTDVNKYFIEYNISNIDIQNSVKHNLYVKVGNANWEFTNSYDLKVIETKKYGIFYNEIDDEINKYSIVFIILITLIFIFLVKVVLIRRAHTKKCKRVEKSYLTSKRRKI